MKYFVLLACVAKYGVVRSSVSDYIEHVSSCPKSLLRWHTNTLVPVGNQVSMELT